MTRAKPKWNAQIEEVLREWGERGQAFRWMHYNSWQAYSKLNLRFIVPIVFLNSIAGVSNFGLDSLFPVDQRPLAILIVGGINIFAGLLTTLMQYLQVPQLLESHRQASISWGKFSRNIKTELSLPQGDRISVSDFLKMCRAELDRLSEQSPPIRQKVIDTYQRKFYKIENYGHPEIANGLKRIQIFIDPEVVTQAPNTDENFHDALEE